MIASSSKQGLGLALIATVLAGGIFHQSFKATETQAQVSGITIPYLTNVIGGYTEGIGKTVCCNGVVLSFKSVNPLNLAILDGEALFIPGFSTSYMNWQEANIGFCTLGNLVTTTCLNPELDCLAGQPMPTIISIGTSGLQCPAALLAL